MYGFIKVPLFTSTTHSFMRALLEIWLTNYQAISSLKLELADSQLLAIDHELPALRDGA
jgi:hypothetical protein